MTTRVTRVVSAIGLAASVAGCGATAPSRFYTLGPAAVADAPPAERLVVVVAPVSIPAAVDRPQFVVQIAPHQVEIDEYHRWAAPLADAIAGTIAADLTVLLGVPNVATAPLVGLTPTHRVTVDVQRFESVPGKEALVEAVWSVRKDRGGATTSGRTVAREATADPGFEALAAAHSHALAKVSADIAAGIRSLR